MLTSTPIATRDGVAATVIGAASAARELPAVHVIRDDVIVDANGPQYFDSSTPLGPRDYAETGDGVIIPADRVYGARIAVCMQEADWPVTMLVGGSLALVGEVTPAGIEELEAALARCELQAGYR